MASLLGGFAGLGGGSIGRASVDLVLNNTAYNEQLAATESKTKASTSAMSGGFSKFQKDVRSSFSGAQTAFVAFGAVAAIAIAKGIGATTAWAAQVRSLQRVTGQSAESASALAGAGSILGIEVAKLNTGFGLLEKNIVNNSANLVKYGIATKDATGNVLPFDKVLAAVSDKFATLPKGPEQAAFAMNVFGRSGKDLIPILQQGSAGLATLEQKAKDAGLVMSQDTLNAAKDLSRAQRELGDAFKGAAIQLGTAFLPVMTVTAHGLTALVEVVQLIPKPVLALGAAFVVAGAGILIAQKAFVALRAASTGALGSFISIIPLLTAVAGLATFVGGRIADMNIDFTKMAKQTKINADLLKFFGDRMEYGFGSARHQSFAGFIASLNGIGPNLKELTDKTTPLVDRMDKLGLGVVSTTNVLSVYKDTVDGSTGAIDNYVRLTSGQIDSIAALEKAYGHGDLTLGEFTRGVTSFGINHKDVFFLANAALDSYNQHLDSAGHKTENFAGMSSSALKAWAKSMKDNFDQTMSSFGPTIKNTFDMSAKELINGYQHLAAIAFRYAGDLAAITKMKPSQFGLTRTEWEQFTADLQSRGMNAVDAFAGATQANQRKAIAAWENMLSGIRRDHAAFRRQMADPIPIKFQVQIAGLPAGSTDLALAVRAALLRNSST